MAKVTHRQAFVPTPLLRAIEHLPDAVEVDGVRLELAGRTEHAMIVAGFAAFRAHVVCGRSTGWIDLSTAGSWRTDMTLRLVGVPAPTVERLLLALRAELIERTATPDASASDARMEVCRTA